jgi:hypothetical protein
MVVYLNNRNSIIDIRSALTLINNLQNNIIEYNNLCDIINIELSYILRYKSQVRNVVNMANQPLPPSRDVVLCALINKLDGFYIKTPEVKKIINYISSYSDVNFVEYTWFIKNIEKGYNPTAPVLLSVIPHLKINNIEYLYNKFSSKIKSTDVFTFKTLYNTVFGYQPNNNPEKSHEIFTKFKLTNIEIGKIIEENSYIKNYNDIVQPQNINNYITNIINYKKKYMLKFTFNEMLYLLNWLQMRNIIIPLMNEKYKGDDIDNIDDVDVDDIDVTRNNFKNIVNHFNSNEIVEIITIILLNTGTTNGFTNIQSFLNFLINYCSFDKIKKNNISNILKNSNINRFPFVMLEQFYDDDKDIELIELIFNYNINDVQIADLLINKNFTTCSNEELFNLAFEKGNINIIKHFINKKFVITEDMILNNYSEKLLDILIICAENGFYITEKCFPHIIYVMYINGLVFDISIDKIKKSCIYVNDTEEFEKHKITMRKLYDSYNYLENNVLNTYNNTIQYLKNNPITKEMIVISTNRRVRNYLLNKMIEDKQKTIKKVIVKKIVKKVVKKPIET